MKNLEKHDWYWVSKISNWIYYASIFVIITNIYYHETTIKITIAIYIMTFYFYKVLDIKKSTEVCFIILITLLIIIFSVKKTMTLSSYYKKDFHFVIVGTVKSESKGVALELLKTIMNKSEEIKDISELHIFGKTL